MKNSGQTALIFTLVLGGLLTVLISSVTLSYSNLTKEIEKLRVRIDGYQATVQISQVIQEAFTVATKYPTCSDPSFGTLTLVNTGVQPLCMPTGAVCVNTKFCIAQAGASYMISKIDGSTPRQDIFQNVPEKKWSLKFALINEAQAQNFSNSWLPNLAGAPVATIGLLPCASTNTCTICAPAANANANCYKVRVCTNSSSSCASPDNYFDALVAIVYQKL